MLDRTVIDLEDQQMSTYSEQIQQRISQLYVQMDVIEQDSIASMQLDPVLETKLCTLQDELYNKYSNINHFTYVGDNSVKVVYVDAEQQKVILLIDKNKTLGEKIHLRMMSCMNQHTK